MNELKIYEKKDSDFYTLLIAFFFSIPSINKIISTIIPFLSGTFMVFCYFCIITIFSFYVFFRNSLFSLNRFNIFVIFFLIIVYIKTSFQDALSSVSFVVFFIYVLLPLFFQNIKINVDLFIKMGMVFPFWGVFFYDKIFIVNLNSIGMGASYVFLFPVVCSITYFCKIPKKNIFFTIISILNFIYLFEILFHGSRGAVLCIMIFFFLLFVFTKKEENGLILKSYKTFFLSILSLFFIIFLIDNIVFFNHILQSYNLQIEAIDKVIRMQQMNDLSNGREKLQAVVINDFLNEPWLGHGLSTVNYFHPKINYPHNFLLQMLYDLGILGSAPLIFFIVRGLIIWKNKCTKDEYILFLCLFSSSIPCALFSGDLWKNALLWMTLGFLISFNQKKDSIQLSEI